VCGVEVLACSVDLEGEHACCGGGRVGVVDGDAEVWGRWVSMCYLMRGVWWVDVQ